MKCKKEIFMNVRKLFILKTTRSTLISIICFLFGFASPILQAMEIIEYKSPMEIKQVPGTDETVNDIIRGNIDEFLPEHGTPEWLEINKAIRAATSDQQNLYMVVKKLNEIYPPPPLPTAVPPVPAPVPVPEPSPGPTPSPAPASAQSQQY